MRGQSETIDCHHHFSKWISALALKLRIFFKNTNFYFKFMDQIQIITWHSSKWLLYIRFILLVTKLGFSATKPALIPTTFRGVKLWHVLISNVQDFAIYCIANIWRGGDSLIKFAKNSQGSTLTTCPISQWLTSDLASCPDDYLLF